MRDQIKIAGMVFFHFLFPSAAFSMEMAKLDWITNLLRDVTLGRDLVVSPGEGCPGVRHPRREHLETLSFFPDDAPTVLSDIKDKFTRVVLMRLRSGRVSRGEIHYHVQKDREYAERLQHIFRDENPKDLPPGKTYNFIIAKNGQMDFGEVRDGWEYGVRHVHLAGGREILAAGELQLGLGGFCQFNLNSGSLTYKLLQDNPEYEYRFLEAVKKVFLAKMDPDDCDFADQALLPNQPPEEVEIAQLCRNYWFWEDNPDICKYNPRPKSP